MRIKPCIYYLLITFFCFVNFKVLSKSIDLTPHTTFFKDSLSLSLNEIISKQNNDEFSVIIDGNINFGYQSLPLWFYSKVFINDDSTTIFQIENSYAEYLDLYFFYHDTLIERHTGNKTKFQTRGELQPISYAYRIGCKAGDTLQIYTRIRTHSPLIYPSKLKSDHSFIQFEQNSALLYGVFFGILFIMLFYNGFIAYSLKDWSYWFYTFMVLASILTFAGESGVLYKYVFPEFYWMSPFEKKIPIPLLIVTTSLFFVSFLDVKNYSKIIYYLVVLQGIIGAIITLYSSFFEVYGIGSIAITIHAPALLLYAILLYKKENKDAKPYIVAWSLYLVMGMTMTLRNLAFLPSIFITEHGAEIGAILEVTLLSFALAERIKRIRKEKTLLEKKHLKLVLSQNVVLEQKVTQRTIDLNSTLEVINKQNIALIKKDELVTSSLSYAKRIQDTFSPDIEDMKTHFNDVCFLYKPRDIVSGDFMFYKTIKEISYIVLADCTGHGVPGALMSILGYNLLYDAIQVLKLNEVNDILTFLDREFNSRLSQKDEKIEDGMEVAIVIIDKAQGTLTFSGAAQPLFYQTMDGHYHYVKGSIKPIGGNPLYYKSKLYEEHIFNLDTIRQFYLFSDGFEDQFGGSSNTKFSRKSFFNLLSSLEDKNGQDKGTILDNTFEEYKSLNDQTDDVIVVGVTL